MSSLLCTDQPTAGWLYFVWSATRKTAMFLDMFYCQSHTLTCIIQSQFSVTEPQNLTTILIINILSRQGCWSGRTQRPGPMPGSSPASRWRLRAADARSPLLRSSLRLAPHCGSPPGDALIGAPLLWRATRFASGVHLILHVTVNVAIAHLIEVFRQNCCGWNSAWKLCGALLFR